MQKVNVEQHSVISHVCTPIRVLHTHHRTIAPHTWVTHFPNRNKFSFCMQSTRTKHTPSFDPSTNASQSVLMCILCGFSFRLLHSNDRFQKHPEKRKQFAHGLLFLIFFFFFDAYFSDGRWVTTISIVFFFFFIRVGIFFSFLLISARFHCGEKPFVSTTQASYWRKSLLLDRRTVNINDLLIATNFRFFFVSCPIAVLIWFLFTLPLLIMLSGKLCKCGCCYCCRCKIYSTLLRRDVPVRAHERFELSRSLGCVQ